MESKLIDLGNCVIKIIPQEKRIQIFQQSSMDEGAYEPTQEVIIWGEDKLIKIRDALVDVLK